ncbi:MAG: hypothetical protein MR902_02420 [Campylobacter sp.]|nr:hypothetical protein [Campylobacter sp.]
MKIGLLGNKKIALNSNALKISSGTKSKITKKSNLVTQEIPKVTKTAHLSRAIYHNKAMWSHYYDKKGVLKLDRVLDFEMITEEKILKLKLRNASDESMILNEINLAGSGLSVVGTQVGDIYKKWEYKEITIIASNIGDIDANSLLTFVFDKQTIIITIKGTRAVVFSYRPKYGYTDLKSIKQISLQQTTPKKKELAYAKNQS